MTASLRDADLTAPTGRARLDKVVRDTQPSVSWGVVRRAIRTGKVRVDDAIVREPGELIGEGQRVVIAMAAPREPKLSLGDDAMVFADRHIVVVRKPAGIASVPDQNWKRNALSQVLAEKLRRGRTGKRQIPLGVVQRLDVDTTGLLVFTRSQEAHEPLKTQFKKRQVKRSYLAIVSGSATDTTYRSYLREHKNGKRSSTKHRHLGKYAVTHVEVIERLVGATLVRCRLETGRTHQIRIHLSEAGHPLLGDARYARRAVQTPQAPRVMLHAGELGFMHPVEEEELFFEEPMPEDMEAVLTRLRRPAT
ncbi:MAG: RluA family pseudouridine synthase [Polyangiaceae bacterium]